MFVIISYDIEKDRTRTRLAKALKNFGSRVQKSVFEADISEDEYVRLKKLLNRVRLEERDSIRLYVLCRECKRKTQIWGVGEITEDRPYYIA